MERVNIGDKLPITGGCYCGAIRYEVSEKPLKTGVCHCHSCQRQTGGSSLPFVLIKAESLKIHGDLKEFARVGSSGNKVHVGFCPHCGTTLFGRPELYAHLRTVSASTLDDAKSFVPSMHVWTEDAPSWDTIDPSTPQFRQNPR